MRTVTEVSKLTGVSVRTLHHYDAIGLLKPTEITPAGYRLYDDTAIERLYMILVFRELGLSLKEIADFLQAPVFDRNLCVERQIKRMQAQVGQLQNQIALAKGILSVGVNEMNFKDYDPKKINEYSTQAKALYGKTDAYIEYQQKSKNRTQAQDEDLGMQVMEFFARLGKMRPCAPDSDAALAWAQELQDFFTAHYYTCTPQILASLAESYADGGSMTENIDKAGGPGTGIFAKEVIHAYLRK